MGLDEALAICFRVSVLDNCTTPVMEGPPQCFMNIDFILSPSFFSIFPSRDTSSNRKKIVVYVIIRAEKYFLLGSLAGLKLSWYKADGEDKNTQKFNNVYTTCTHARDQGSRVSPWTGQSSHVKYWLQLKTKLDVESGICHLWELPGKAQ